MGFLLEPRGYYYESLQPDRTMLKINKTRTSLDVEWNPTNPEMRLNRRITSDSFFLSLIHSFHSSSSVDSLHFYPNHLVLLKRPEYIHWGFLSQTESTRLQNLLVHSSSSLLTFFLSSSKSSGDPQSLFGIQNTIR